MNEGPAAAGAASRVDHRHVGSPVPGDSLPKGRFTPSQTNRRNLLLSALSISLLLANQAEASGSSILTGTINSWEESGPVMTIGDGTHHVSLWWSVYSFDRGWFYGGSDSDVAFATGVTEISQITDASSFLFTSVFTGPHCDADCDRDKVGDFLLWKNRETGYYGALRIDDIYPIDPNDPDPGDNAALNGTWWFQADGSGDFSTIPEPTSFTLLGLGSLALVMVRRRM